MIMFQPKGAIFDVDDTLLDNKTAIPEDGLHERSRLAAVHAVGKSRGIPALERVTPGQNVEAFRSAPVHTTDAAVWGILQMAGLADSEVINPGHELLKEIVALKNSLHGDVLRRCGTAYPGAVSFVRALGGVAELHNRLAIASTAVRQDIDIFLEMTKLEGYFPDARINSRESVTHPKPHPEVFDLAFVSLGLAEHERKEVCAFEDDPRGIMSAKAAGLYVCAITTRYSRRDLQALAVPPDYVADSFAEFAEYFGLTVELPVRDSGSSAAGRPTTPPRAT